MISMPKVLRMSPKRLETNALPLSLTATAGNPNLATQDMKAWHTSSAESLDRGNASVHLEQRSRMLRRNLLPPLSGRGPTMSTWIYLNL